MIRTKEFSYEPTEHESEVASNSYLMSLIAIVVGIPLPIINLIATLIFYAGNSKGTYFIRWHCTQALLAQVSMLFINSFILSWTVLIIFTDEIITDKYILCALGAIVFNIIEFVSTIYMAIQVRKGKHLEMFGYSLLTNIFCRP